MTVMSELIGDSVVGPAPWYWKTFPTFGDAYEWRFIAKAGAYPIGSPALFRNAGRARDPEPVLLVRTYGRAVRANNDHILLWGPRRDHNDLLLETYALRDLQPIITTEESEGKDLWVTNSAPLDRVSIPAGLPAGRAPDRYVARAAAALTEVLLLAEGPSPEVAAVSIYAWIPAEGSVDVMPQPWFNHKTADLGYEWITRVTRRPSNGHILGDGIRIAPFELDENGRLLRRTLNKPREGPLSTWLRSLRRQR